MNIIFLDIDGVLNDFERSWRDVPDYCPDIVPRCVVNLNKIIRATEAKLVLSSSWKALITQGHMTVYGFERLLQTHGVRSWLLAHTPHLEGERWGEIDAWLNAPWQISKKPVEIDRYCILDDYGDAFGGRPGVKTSGAVGLTEADATAAIEVLTK